MTQPSSSVVQSSSSVVQPTGEERRRTEAQAAKSVEAPKELDALHTLQGDTTIADSVVQKIAGIAAREVPGVYAMGNATRRAMSSISQRIPGSSPQNSVTGGVSVQKGERETVIEVTVVIEYGASLVDVADQIRENVIRAVERGTGLAVVSVDVNVTDVHLPDDDTEDNASGSTDLR